MKNGRFFKQTWVATMLVACLLVLAACGGGNNGNAVTGSGVQEQKANGSSDKVTIRYWYAFGGKIEEAKQELVKRFNASQDRIEVIAEHQGNYDDLHAKVQAAYAAGNPPAVSDLEIGSTGLFARSGMLEPLQERVTRDDAEVNFADFHPGLMGNAYVDGTLYGLPFMRSTPIMYVNSTMLQDAGLNPDGPSTWEEMAEMGRTLKTKGKTAMTVGADIWFYEALVAQSGGQMLSEDGKKSLFNSPEGVAPVTFWKSMVDEGTLKMPVSDDAGAVADKDWANQLSAFKFGSTAGVSGSLEIAQSNGFEMRAAFMPANVDYGVPTGGCQLVMIAGLSEEEQEAAWEFIKFMTTTESTIYQHKYVGYLPTRLSALESEEIKTHFEANPAFKVAFDQLEYARPRPMENAYPEIAKIIKEAIQKSMIDTKTTPQQAMDEAAAKADRLLNP